MRSAPVLLSILLLALILVPTTSHAAAPPPAWGTGGMVATAHPLATEAGWEVLNDGGTAVDAALAAIYTLDVVCGYSEGLGGGEFWVIRDGETGDVRRRRPISADFRSPPRPLYSFLR